MATIRVVLEAARPPYPEVVRAYEATDYKVLDNERGNAILHITKSGKPVACFFNWSYVEIEQDEVEVKPVAQYQTTDLTYEKPRVAAA